VPLSYCDRGAFGLDDVCFWHVAGPLERIVLLMASYVRNFSQRRHQPIADTILLGARRSPPRYGGVCRRRRC
jgi:hypothetical protein